MADIDELDRKLETVRNGLSGPEWHTVNEARNVIATQAANIAELKAIITPSVLLTVGSLEKLVRKRDATIERLEWAGRGPLGNRGCLSCQAHEGEPHVEGNCYVLAALAEED